MLQLPASSSACASVRQSAARLLTAACLLALIAGCPSDDSNDGSSDPGTTSTTPIEAAPAPQTGPTGVTEVRSTEEELPDEVLAAVPKTLKPGELDPIIRAHGAEGAIPDGFVIELARDVAAPSQVGGRPLDGTAITIEPAVDGGWRFTTPSTLRFRPATALQPDTTYTVTIEAIGTPHAVLRPQVEGGGSPTAQVTTPGFRLLRADWSFVNPEQQLATVELAFSGPVSSNAVRERLDLRVGGETLSPTLVTTNDPKVVRAELRGRFAKAGNSVSIRLGAGVPMRGHDGAKADGRSVSLSVPKTPAVNVLAMRRGEGPTGFYVDVICRDEAAPDGWNGWWDDVTSTWYDLTSRCIPADATGIRVSPSVGDLRVSPIRQGFRVLGDFSRGVYTMTLDPSLTSKDGGALPGPRVTSFSIPARAAQVQFVSKGRYLPESAWSALPVRHLNVSELTATIRHVPERNLVHWLTGDSEVADATTSDLVAEIKVPVMGPADDFGTTWVDLSEHVPSRARGVYEIRVAAGESSDVARVMTTKVHLVAKMDAVAPEQPYSSGLDVWAIDADTSKPVGGAELDVRRQSGTVLATCTTSGDGHCRLDLSPDPVDPEPPYVVIAKSGGDLTYLRFSDLRTPLTESAVAGDPYLAPEAYRVAFYSDRGVYRPGETSHIVAIVRGEDRKAPPKGMPVTLAVSDPRGRVLGRHQLQTDSAGLVTHDAEFGDWAPTGRYTATLTAGDDDLGSYSFYVEEFVPERMEVDASLAATNLLASDEVTATVEARYLFGGSAEGSPAEVDCELVPTTFKPPKNGNFTYGPWYGEDDDDRRGLSLGSAAGELDRDGRVTLSCPTLGDATSFEGTATLVARAVVFEAGSGRSTQTSTRGMAHPERFYVGMQTGTEEGHGGEPINVSGVVVDWAGEPAGDKQIELVAYRLEDHYGWFYDEDDGWGSYRRSIRRVEEGQATVTSQGGAFSWTYTPEKDAAGYLIEARSGNAHTGLHVDGTSSYWWWSDPSASMDATPKPLKPGSLELTLPDSVKLGKKSEVTFTAPYAGRALMTVETAGVRAWEWIDVQPGPTAWPFTVQEFAPNVYVSALLVKDPHADSAETYLADRAFGVGSVRVDAKKYTQELTVTAPEEVRPRSELTIQVAAPGADKHTVVTVAAVDEGILQLTDFASPDPLKDLLAKRALGVESFETVGWSVLVPPEGSSSSIGGDAPGDGYGRVQPVEPVALWSGVVPVKGGKATVTFDVPRYRGKLRVMAVSVGTEKVGHAEASVFVREPLIVQATLPRFLMESDRVDVPVFVTNMSGAPRDVVVSLEADDVGPKLAGVSTGAPVRFVTATTQRLSLGDGESGTAVFEVEATRQVGTVEFTATATAAELSSVADATVPFSPDGPRTRVLHKVELTAGANDLSEWLAGWVPTTERTTVRVSSNPYGDVFDHLSYVVRYPYGCLEQTTSSTRPMLFVDRLIQQVDPEIAADQGIAKRVEHGIRRVLTMQTGSGGFAYWPGSDSPRDWATAYATHMLLDARERGYEVPDGSLDRALRWMEEQIDGGESDREYYGWGKPYMHYVLARAGRGRKAQAGALLASHEDGEDGRGVEHAYLLKAALYQAGDRRWEQDLKTPDVSPVSSTRRNGWSFYSDRRRRGMTLTIFGELFGNDVAGEELASLVASALQGKKSRWYTTQELVWGITGLGRRISSGAKDFSVPALAAGGTELEARWTDRDTSERAWEVNRLSERGAVSLTIESKGEGALYALISSQGVEEGAAWEEKAAGIRVTRRYLDFEGAAIDPTAVTLGDLVVVRVDLTNTTAEAMRNVAMVDRLPAGFEIENANLGRDRVISVVDSRNLWSIDHRNVRDDRVEAFGTLPKGKTVSYVYAVRATSAGDFVVPPVEAEAMYEPSYQAREVGDRVVINGPWGGMVDAEEPGDEGGE